MKKKAIVLLSLVVLMVGLASVSAADSDNSATTDNSGSDVATDSSSSTTAQATDTSTHTDSSVDKTSDTSTTSSSSQKTDVTSQQTTQKVSEKTSENTQTTSDTTAKASSDTTSKVSSDTSSQSIQSTSQSTQTIQSDSNTTKASTNTITEKTVDNTKSISTDDSSVVFVVNQTTYQDIFIEETDDTPAGLSDLVNDGDVLDVQGTVIMDYKITIDKPINLTSTTNDGVITSNDDLMMRVTISEGGSNTNVTNITVYNSEFFILKAHDIIIDNINVTNINKGGLGANTGVFSMRENCTNIVVKNSYFYTEDNGGHSTLVSGGANHITIDNCTIIGVGQVGNLVYLTTFNTEEGAVNGYTNITNNTIIGPRAQAICRAVTLSGSNIYVANNFINYTGEGVTGQFHSDTEDESVNSTYVVNNTVVGTSISVSGAVVINNTADAITATNGNVIGNVVNNLSVNSGDSVIIANNTVKNHLTINSTNCTVDESNILVGENATLTVYGTDNNIHLTTTYEDENIGNLKLEVLDSNNVIENINANNGNLTIQGSNNVINNVTIQGNGKLNVSGSNNIISNITYNDSTINITNSNNTLEKFNINGDLKLNMTSSENILNNILVSGNSEVQVFGNDNTISNNSFIKTTTVYGDTEKSQHVIILNGTNNTVTYNYLVALDLFNNVVNNGDDAVSNAENNIVHDNYGNGTLPDYEKTYVIYEITSFEELKEVLENIKANETLTNDEIAVINFKDGDYIATESLTLDDAIGTIDSIIFNGTSQEITAQDLTLFITVGEGYNLTINNLTLKDFISGEGSNTIVNNGTLLISNSTLDNIFGIVSSNEAFISIQGNIFKNDNSSSILSISSLAEIINNTFQDTKGSNVLINLEGDYILFANNIIENINVSLRENIINYNNINGVFIYENNTMSNITSWRTVYTSDVNTEYIRNNTFIDIISSDYLICLNNGGTIVYIENNTFLNINGNVIYSYINSTYICNNTFINDTDNIFRLRDPSTCEIEDNTYINCSLNVYISDVSDCNVSTEDFTTNINITTDDIYNLMISDGQILVYINGEEYKTFEVVNGETTITIENSALKTYYNEIDLKYVPVGNDFNENTTSFIITATENSEVEIFNVTSFEELKEVIDEIKSQRYATSKEYLINLLEGDYTVTETLSWDNVLNSVHSLILNGTGQTINLNSNTLITIAEGYTLTINNLNIQDNEISNKNALENKGNLTISDSTFINSIIYNENSFINVTYSNFTDSIFKLSSSIGYMSNNNFYDTDLSKFSDISGMIYYEYSNLTFNNNNVNNVTGNNILLSHSAYPDGGISNSSINNNTFSNTDKTILNLDMDLRTWNMIQMGMLSIETKIINNTFINSTYDGNLFEGDSLGDADYTKRQNNTYINCNLVTSMDDLFDTTITTEDYNTTITITTDDSYNLTVNEGQLIIYINGIEYKSFNVENGEANITIENSALNLLENQILIQYVSDGTFRSSNTSFKITVNEDMRIKIPEGNIYSGDTISIPVQVAVNGSLAKDGYVILKVNGKTVKDENGTIIEVQVDENGNAVINYTIPDTTSDEYNITVIYAGSEGVVRSSTTLTRSLKNATIVVDQITAKPGQTVTLTAHITDQNNNPITTGKLIFKLNGKTLKDSDGNTLYATIENGLATLVYTIPDNFSAKDYILTAVYQGNGFERSEANNTLTLIKTTPTIIPDSSVFGSDNKITITQGTESIQIKATINDPETNAPINTTTIVTIKINDKTVTQQYVTDGQIDIEVFTSSFKNPEYNITVVVGENSQYERTSFNGTLEIVSPNGLATGSSYNGTLLVKED